MNKSDYEFSARLLRLANRGAHLAQERARAAGVSVVYALNGQLVEQFPDGSVKMVK
jgi:hypothetical protein